MTNKPTKAAIMRAEHIKQQLMDKKCGATMYQSKVDCVLLLDAYRYEERKYVGACDIAQKWAHQAGENRERAEKAEAERDAALARVKMLEDTINQTLKNCFCVGYRNAAVTVCKTCLMLRKVLNPE